MQPHIDASGPPRRRMGPQRAARCCNAGRPFTTAAASVALAQQCGFREVGVCERHGRLDGRSRDLLVVEAAA